MILSHTTIGRGAVIHRAILDKHVTVEEGAKVGSIPKPMKPAASTSQRAVSQWLPRAPR